MNLRREANKTIWKTVVFAGAMLGSAGCSKKAAPTTPTATDTATDETATPPDDTTANPCGDGADPCADNPCRDRGSADPCEGGEGRGFILS